MRPDDDPAKDHARYGKMMQTPVSPNRIWRKSMPSIGEIIASQYDRAWEMLRKTVQRIPEDRWTAGDNPNLWPARWAYHTVVTADFYSRESPDGFGDGLFGSEWTEDASTLPTKQQLLDYLDRVQSVTREWLTGLSDEAMGQPSGFPWTGGNILEQNLYQLRHTMAHTGELSMFLRTLGESEAEWS